MKFIPIDVCSCLPNENGFCGPHEDCLSNKGLTLDQGACICQLMQYRRKKVDKKLHHGPTMADIKDPGKRIIKLRERVYHINQQIAELEDRKGIIEHEISELRGTT